MKDVASVQSGRRVVGLRHDLDTVYGSRWGLKVFPETLLN